MASARAGFNSILFCDKGTLATTPTNPIYMGFRGPAKINITPFKGIKEYLEGEHRNMKNFKFSAETFQCTMQMLKAFISWLNESADIQVVTAKQSASTQDIWAFTGNYLLGLGLEFLMNGDKRSLTVNCERAFPFETAKTLIDMADAGGSIVDVDGITDPRGRDSSMLRRPFFLAFESPITTSLASIGDILERSFSMKTVGKPSIDNQMIVDYLMFELTLKVRDASIAKMIAHMTRDAAASVLWKESNGGAFYDAFEFAANTLLQVDEFENSDDERTITMKFQRKIELFDLSFNFGATYGGDAGDSAIGAKGGTIKVGY